MKMKEFGPPGGGARPWRPPWIRQCNTQEKKHDTGYKTCFDFSSNYLFLLSKW